MTPDVIILLSVLGIGVIIGIGIYMAIVFSKSSCSGCSDCCDSEFEGERLASSGDL